MIIGTALYGDGFYANIIEISADPEDVTKYVVKVVPFEKTMQRFHLDINDAARDRRTGAWTRKYKREDVKQVYQGEFGGSYIIFCDFNGNQTGLLESIGVFANSQIKFLNERLRIEQMRNSAMLRDMQKLINQPGVIQKQALEQAMQLWTADKKQQGSEEGGSI